MRSRSVARDVGPNYSAVIFDLFGTLVPAYDHRAVLTEMASVLDAPVDEFIRAFAEDTKEGRETGRIRSLEENIRLICSQLGCSASSNRVGQAAEVRRGFTKKALRPRSDAISTLQSLGVHGIRLGLISDCCEIVPALWDETDLAPYFNTTVFSCRVSVRKPDCRIYEIASSELSVSPSRCLYVGDGGSNELSGATEAGMRAALLLVEGERFIDPYRSEIDGWSGPVINSLSEVLGLLTL